MSGENGMKKPVNLDANTFSGYRLKQPGKYLK